MTIIVAVMAAVDTRAGAVVVIDDSDAGGFDRADLIRRQESLP